MEEQTIDDVIFKIEDYVGGNIEGVETIDRMSFTVFLRHTLNALMAQEKAALLERVERSIPAKEYMHIQYEGIDDMVKLSKRIEVNRTATDVRNALIDQIRTALATIKADLSTLSKKEGRDGLL